MIHGATASSYDGVPADGGQSDPDDIRSDAEPVLADSTAAMKTLFDAV